MPGPLTEPDPEGMTVTLRPDGGPDAQTDEVKTGAANKETVANKRAMTVETKFKEHRTIRHPPIAEGLISPGKARDIECCDVHGDLFPGFALDGVHALPDNAILLSQKTYVKTSGCGSD
jgi:hypothetical protein